MTRNKTNQGVRSNENPLTRDVNAVNRVALALKMRSSKAMYSEIAAACGYGSAQAAHKAVQRELQRVVVENVDELRREEMMMLDQMQAEVWPLMLDKSNKGRLFAVDRVLAISERRSKLFGLDQPAGAINSNVVVVRETPPGYLGILPQKTVEGSPA